ncbi:MAG: hypothetical protein KAT46_02300 [Deltaproteobacteria bacterium]|nr:hypothetical protein [Deltaproteobacteria bacterium]
MEKRSERMHLYFSPATVHFDQLEEIYIILQKYFDKIEMSFKKADGDKGEYSIDSLAEIENVKIKSVEFRAWFASKGRLGDGIDVNLGGFFTGIFYKDSCEKAMICAPQVEKILSRHPRLLYKFVHSFISSGFVMYPVVGMSVILTMSDLVYGWVFLLIGMFYILLALNKLDEKIIFLCSRDKKSFWEKNKDQVILSTISALVGGLIAWLVAYFT